MFGPTQAKIGNVTIDSTNAKTCLTVFDPRFYVLTNFTKGNMCSIELDPRFDPNWLCLDRLDPFGYVLNNSTRGKMCSIVFDENQL